eukprot:COSAG05_NODE_1111_length_5857_cov_6.789337_2_plen_73_part_00
MEASCGPHPHKNTNLTLGEGEGPRCDCAARLPAITLRASRYHGEDDDWAEARAAADRRCDLSPHGAPVRGSY